jgi:hypothetical protein
MKNRVYEVLEAAGMRLDSDRVKVAETAFLARFKRTSD